MTVAEQERDKYAKMWQRPEYRGNSPGLRHAAAFLARVEKPAEKTIIDLGCGTGRAARYFADYFKRVYGLDICAALDEGTGERIHFIQACLWEPFPSWMYEMKFDWFYCTDVMEHIPPEYVGSTLDAIVDLNCAGGFFSIAHHEDDCGKLIGSKLHLTVESPEWWREKIEQRWDVESWIGSNTSLIFVRRPEHERRTN